MIDHLLLSCLPACVPADTNAHRKSHVSVRYKMDARQHELQSQGHHSPFAAGNPSLACLTRSCVPSFVVSSLVVHSAQSSSPARPTN